MTAAHSSDDPEDDCLLDTDGDLLDDYREVIDAGVHLAVLPIARVHLDWFALTYPGAVTFYPPGSADLEALNITPNNPQSTSLAETSAAASGVEADTLSKHVLAVFPYRFEWDRVIRNSHASHLEFIRNLSEHVDRSCLNLVRYRQCPIDKVDCLPARAGQIESNHMMAGAVLYNHALRQARIFGGDAFTHYFTRGLGLPLESIAHSDFPRDGEVGFIVNHGLSLYSMMLEASSQTSKFVQCLALLEFLAFPHDYEKFEKVKKVIARYIATNASEYDRLLDRFFELTGKKDASGRQVGYRTCVIHMGKRIEDLVPDDLARTALFLELCGYIKGVMDHMLAHSEKTFDEYKDIRDGFRPFEL